ncbi:unnamed protein product [Phaedon cochleariae]|uniref:Gamma-interferon-inducible lysosomal thiol reductase n=1 Tax=Phaedon cochleariae TaxID=80249 RepID=A0A9P0GL50_PHACE|nr:unnamed protein product [Phaedon cochleariae]
MYSLKFFVLCFVLATVCAAPRTSENVKITLYYEGLCPYCHNFVLNQLYPAYKKLGDAIAVELIPYGNARRQLVEGKWIVTCQHGEEECYSNKVQACVLGLGHTTEQTLDFVNCLFTGEPDEKTAKQCSDKGKLDWTALSTCIYGPQGDEFVLALAEKQEALPEKVVYVPWILINDEHNKDYEDRAYDDLVGVVCEILKGAPSACKGV